MTGEDEPDDDERDPLVELFGVDEEDERPHDAPTWLGGISQMTAAVLIVLAVIVAFVVAAIVFRRVWP
jgi:heme/copper-type cytochrome/quinol oxidase subunit 2